MKSIFLSLSTMLLVISSLNLSATTHSIEKIEFKPTKTMELMAQEFNFTDTKEYLRAAQTYVRISEGLEPLQFQSFNEIASIQELVLYFESKQKAPNSLRSKALNDFNIEQAKFANQLGLKVSQLDEFLRAFADLSGKGHYKHIKVANHPSTAINDKKGSSELIRIRCERECQKHISGPKTIEFTTYIAHLANEAQIPLTGGNWDNPFTVEYVNRQGDTFRRELWAHSGAAGGHYKRELPCSNCQSTVQN